VKPLYYALCRSSLVFGSEIKALLHHPDVQHAVNWDAVGQCLATRYTPSPSTVFAGIDKLSPGHCLLATRESVSVLEYGQRTIDTNRPRSLAEWEEPLAIELESAVSRQMLSDVPIGLSLSGGVDSATLLALMSKSGPVQAFSVGFDGMDGNSEVPAARNLAMEHGADFHNVRVSLSDYHSFMNDYAWHLEEPVGNESAAAYYFVAEMARAVGVKVLLTGQGADEIFGGYDRYLAPRYAGLLSGVTRSAPAGVISVIARRARLGEKYERFTRYKMAENEPRSLLDIHNICRPNGERLLPLIRRQCDESRILQKSIEHYERWLAGAPEGTPFERMLWVDARTSLSENLLLAEDKMAMAAGVEARVPFLDLSFTTVAEAVPGRLKIRHGRNKYIQRRFSRRWIGDVSRRKKLGFESPVSEWLGGQLGGRMRDYLHAPDTITAQYLDRPVVAALMDDHISGRQDNTHALFLLLSLEAWHERFFLSHDSG
jgi:asparagine synthase (glutamine-hydrolysing)